MNRDLRFALAALGAVALPTLSHAQVTVFGIVDLAARTVRNEGVGSMKSLASGANAAGRFGVRGAEDLGNGLGAGFHLESTLGADNGTAGATAPAGQFWDRRATVSLSSKSLGELRLGRDFVPTYTNWGRYDPFGYAGLASASNLITGSQTGPIRSAFNTGPNTVVRSSNGVQLILPGGLAGLEGSLFVAPGEGGPAANGQTRFYGARLGYGAKEYNVSVATASSKNDLTAVNTFRDTALAGQVDIGTVRVSGGWRKFKISRAEQTNWLLAATMPLGPGNFKVSYNHAKFDGSVGTVDISANEATQWGVGYVHNLSKNTALYTTAARMANDGRATFTVPGGPSGLRAGGSSSGVELGLRHNF